ncbi:MAG: TauD/TfdA family dioxygenase [Acidobacteriota bacterium]|nr:TauD/TfdA family dioxygenase [Acidobacteriota bacterium]
MLTPFPDRARINIPPALAGELLEGAERLPLYENKDFYSPALQAFVYSSVREAYPDGFDWVVNLIKERIAQWPYCVLVQGLRFDERHRLFVALNRAFGELVGLPYEEPRAQLVHYIQPATDIRSSRGGLEVERLHTDAVDWQIPIDFISMTCVRPDAGGGGRSRVLDLDAIRDEVKTHLGTDTLELLETEPVPWQLHACWGGGLKWRPVLSESSICWRRYTINLALDVNGAKLSDEMLASLDAFEEVISASPHIMDFMLQEGELLFSDNRKQIHSRTAIAAGDASNRLMIRSWINSSGVE